MLGSFRTTLSPPPFFVEERLEWARAAVGPTQVLPQLEALGVGFGACHTEFVVHEGRARIIEVNYRLIGDHCDFLLADLLGVPLFERMLRVHLGEPPAERRSRRRHAMADRSSRTARQAHRRARAASGWTTARCGSRTVPQRAVGDTITLTRTNRDYLGTVRAIGPGPDVDAALPRPATRGRSRDGDDPGAHRAAARSAGRPGGQRPHEAGATSRPRGVLDALLREDYAGCAAASRAGRCALPGGAVRLADARPAGSWPTRRRPGREADGWTEVFAAVRALADPRDDVAAFERECREALRGHEAPRATPARPCSGGWPASRTGCAPAPARTTTPSPPTSTIPSIRPAGAASACRRRT